MEIHGKTISKRFSGHFRKKMVHKEIRNIEIIIGMTTKERNQQRVKEGRCPQCGKWSYPYYLCHEHRITQNIYRVLRNFEKRGWVDIQIDTDGKKMFKWRPGADIGAKIRKYTPEAIAKMQLPRLEGKPMTDKVLEDAILKVIEENGIPMTEKEIEKGIKQLKTIGNVIPETENLIAEYKLIGQKKSNLSKSQRDAVKYKINFLLERKAITQESLTP